MPDQLEWVTLGKAGPLAVGADWVVLRDPMHAR